MSRARIQRLEARELVSKDARQNKKVPSTCSFDHGAQQKGGLTEGGINV
jgi:hypothetical protein